jgi:hypothetical protein
MAKIAFILLCHKDPEAIIRQAERLTATGRLWRSISTPAPRRGFRRHPDALKDNPGVTFATRRVKCGWGEWSLVQASLNAAGGRGGGVSRATHFYMLSGDCMAIKSAALCPCLSRPRRRRLHRKLRFLRLRLDQDRAEAKNG